MQRVQIPFTKSQIRKLRKSIKNETPVNLRISNTQLQSQEGVPFLVTQTQINRMNKVIQKGKGMIIKISESQIKQNKADGGILPFLIPLAIGAASALATGALGAVGNFAVEKVIEAIDGKGLQPLGVGKGLAPLGTGLEQTLTPVGVVVGDISKIGTGLFPTGVTL